MYSNNNNSVEFSLQQLDHVENYIYLILFSSNLIQYNSQQFNQQIKNNRVGRTDKRVQSTCQAMRLQMKYIQESNIQLIIDLINQILSESNIQIGILNIQNIQQQTSLREQIQYRCYFYIYQFQQRNLIQKVSQKFIGKLNWKHLSNEQQDEVIRDIYQIQLYSNGILIVGKAFARNQIRFILSFLIYIDNNIKDFQQAKQIIDDGFKGQIRLTRLAQPDNLILCYYSTEKFQSLTLQQIQLQYQKQIKYFINQWKMDYQQQYQQTQQNIQILTK